MSSFLDQLRRRNVIRVGIAYLAIAWLILQVAEMLLPVYGFTDAAIRNVVTLLAVGLPITLALSWAFEWTPSGIVKDSGEEPAGTASQQGNKGFDRFIIVVLVVAIGFFSVDKFILDPARDARDIEAATEQGRASALEAVMSDKSVAVLPFSNRSTLEDDVYFVDGIHDDILTQLARISALVVTSRTSVEQFRDTSETIQDIGAALGVRAILNGGVQRSGDRVRINVRLVDAAKDSLLWGDTYVRELTAANIFAVQAEIASAVAGALQAALLPEEETALQQTPTNSIEAYDLYLLGRYHWRKRTKESIDLAKVHFEQAIQQDPGYVLALSGLADSYVLSRFFGNLTGEVAHPLAQQAIDQAMAIDDSVSEVWASLGLLRRSQGNFAEAEEAFLRALELDDRNVPALIWYSAMLRLARRDEEGMAALLRALELEPMSHIINERLAHLYDERGEFERAIHHFNRADQLDERDAGGFQMEIAWSLFWNGEFARAVEALRTRLAGDPDDISSMWGLVRAYLAMGDIAEARTWNDRASAITVMYRGGYTIPAAQQDYASAIIYLEETLRLEAPRRELEFIHGLFEMHFRSGDIEAARRYLAEYVDDMGGELEISPRNQVPLQQLAAAAFWMLHGDEAMSEPETGRALVEEIHGRLTDMADMGWHRPGMFISLAAADALLGNTPDAIARFNEAIDHGYRNQRQSLANPAFDAIRNTPEFELALGRMQAEIENERARLATINLPPYTPPTQFEPIALPRAVMASYVGWYSNGNVMAQIFFDDNNEFSYTYGPQPAAPLLPISNDEFFTPVATDFTVQFFLGEDETPTHLLVKGAYGDMRMKHVDAPPPRIELSPDVLACYEGTYAFDRLTGLEGERTETDYWVAEIYADVDGKVWIDYDNQPVLEIAPYSQTEFQLVGMEAAYRFVVDPETGQCNEFLRIKDGAEIHFYRQVEAP